MVYVFISDPSALRRESNVISYCVVMEWWSNSGTRMYHSLFIITIFLSSSTHSFFNIYILHLQHYQTTNISIRLLCRGPSTSQCIFCVKRLQYCLILHYIPHKLYYIKFFLFCSILDPSLWWEKIKRHVLITSENSWWRWG